MIKSKHIYFTFFLGFLVSAYASGSSSDDIFTRYIYNDSNQPYVLFSKSSLVKVNSQIFVSYSLGPHGKVPVIYDLSKPTHSTDMLHEMYVPVGKIKITDYKNHEVTITAELCGFWVHPCLRLSSYNGFTDAIQLGNMENSHSDNVGDIHIKQDSFI